jgi:hypothetical protein
MICSPAPWCAIVLALLVAGLASCVPMERADSGGGQTADTTATPSAPPVHGRIILFAPIGLGSLADIYPDASLDFARKAALYIDVLASDATGQVSGHLPDGASPQWRQGLVPAALGAHLVVLTRILDLHRADGIPDSHGLNQRQVAIVEMRGLDRNGTLVFSKKATGEAPTSGSPKFIGETNAPESLASWQAISTCLGSLRTFLRDQQDLPAGTDVEVVIESTPPRADVLVEGAFVGNTPVAIKLPVHQLTVSIELAGFQPWTRHLTPVAGMHIQPVLNALGAPGSAAPETSVPSSAAPGSAAPAHSAPPPSQ